MPFSERTARFREQREQEQQQRRAEERRQSALDQRLEDDREHQRQEERREEAAREWREVEASLEAARVRHATLREQLRSHKVAENREAARRREQRNLFLSELREGLRARRVEAETALKPEQSDRSEKQPTRPLAKKAADPSRTRRNDEKPAERKSDKKHARAASESESAQKNSGRIKPAGLRIEPVPHRPLPERRPQRRDESRDISARRGLRRGLPRSLPKEEKSGGVHPIDALRATIVKRRRQEKRRAERITARVDEARSRQQAVRDPRQRREDQQREAPDTTPENHPSSPLVDRIPSGAISDSLPWLVVRGNQIVTLNGDPIILRGISLLGMDTASPDAQRGFAAGAGITAPVLDAILAWGANLIRLAINQDRVTQGFATWNSADYLADLDRIVEYAASHGAYTLLSLRETNNPIQGEPQPGHDSIAMWRLLGQRYAGEPAVLFDLYTGPHTTIEDDSNSSADDWTLWTTWVQIAVADLRLVHPRSLCFVSGLEAGTNLSGFPVIGTNGEPIPNLVYTAQLFPSLPNPLRAAAALAGRRPVLISEWGGSGAHISWGQQTALILRSAGIGWVAAHWNGEPPLVSDLNSRSVPTGFGNVVAREMILAGESPRAMQRSVAVFPFSNN